MTKIQHVLPATPFRGEVVVEDSKPQAPKPQPEEEVKHGRLVKTLKRLEASEARKEDRAARRETYLVASGERDADELARLDKQADQGESSRRGQHLNGNGQSVSRAEH